MQRWKQDFQPLAGPFGTSLKPSGPKGNPPLTHHLWIHHLDMGLAVQKSHCPPKNEWIYICLMIFPWFPVILSDISDPHMALDRATPCRVRPCHIVPHRFQVRRHLLRHFGWRHCGHCPGGGFIEDWMNWDITRRDLSFVLCNLFYIMISSMTFYVIWCNLMFYIFYEIEKWDIIRSLIFLINYQRVCINYQSYALSSWMCCKLMFHEWYDVDVLCGFGHIWTCCTVVSGKSMLKRYISLRFGTSFLLQRHLRENVFVLEQFFKCMLVLYC